MPSISLPTGLLTLPLPDDLALLHYRALMWAAEHRSDGLLPTAALDVVCRRPDAGELALRLVATGTWTQTATGWRVVTEHRARVSAARAEAGRKGGERSGEVRGSKQTKQTRPVGSPDNPRTVLARASDSELRSGEFQNPTTTPNPSAPTVVAVAPAANPEGARRLAALADAAGEAFTLDGTTAEAVRDLGDRLALLDSARDPAVLAAMGALCATPKKAWPWATAIGTDPIGPAWLLGGRAADGTRTGRPLADLARKAVGVVKAQRAADETKRKAAEERAQRLAAAEAEARQTPEQRAEILRGIRARKEALRATFRPQEAA